MLCIISDPLYPFLYFEKFLVESSYKSRFKRKSNAILNASNFKNLVTALIEFRTLYGEMKKHPNWTDDCDGGKYTPILTFPSTEKLKIKFDLNKTEFLASWLNKYFWILKYDSLNLQKLNLEPLELWIIAEHFTNTSLTKMKNPHSECPKTK